MQPKTQKRPQTTRTVNFPPPDKGWVQSGNIMKAGRDQAEVLDNFIPTTQGARLRGGSIEFADVSSSVQRLFVYSSTSETLFASTTTAVFNASDVEAGSLRTTTSGDWSTTQISTAGGEFLVGVNGADTGFTYNGAAFSDLSLTGVSEDALSQVWLFKERLFFVEKSTQSAWYLPVKSISGTAVELNLGSVFRRGGSLLFGATWSLDSGSGLDDVCLFFSDLGEVAVYEGTDPASASTWSLVGVYDIGQPLNKHAAFKAGGDLAVLTEDGIIPISEALRKDRAALQAVAITFPIEDAWKEVISNRTTAYPITATLWQKNSLLLVGTPSTVDGLPISFAANARTGAWSRFTGWDVRCSVVFGDQLYFGNDDGKILKADSGGSDLNETYVARYVPKFTSGNERMQAVSVGVTYRGSDEFDFDLYAHGDFQVDTMPAPPPFTSTATTVWGTGVWGDFVWGADSGLSSYENWQRVRARGYSLAPGLVVSVNTGTSDTTSVLSDESGNTLTDESGNVLLSSGLTPSTPGAAPDLELLTTRLRVEVGYPL